MNEFKEPLSGAAVQVLFDLQKNVAYWRPHQEWAPADLKRKLELTDQFNQIITEDHIPNIYPLKIMNVEPKQVTTEFVRGVNLAFTGNYDELRDFLLVRYPEDRLNSLIAYLQMIEALNKRSLAFADHKSDSIFYPYNTPHGGITVVDVDGMQNCGLPMLAWKTDRQALVHSDLSDPKTFDLGMFFNKGLTLQTAKRNFGDSYDVIKLPYHELIPLGVDLILNRLPYIESADKLVKELEKYRDGVFSGPSRYSKDPLIFQKDRDKIMNIQVDISEGLYRIEEANRR